MKTADFDFLFRFLGYGEIAKAKLWFVGLEPGNKLNEHYLEENLSPIDFDFPGEQLPLLIDSQLPRQIDSQLPRQKPTRVWPVCRKIAERVGIKEAFFMSNMAPFPYPSLRKHDCGTADETAYKTRVMQEYLPRLLKAKEHFKPSAIVFHGKSYYRALGVQSVFGALVNTGTPCGHVEIFDRQRIILSTNFSRIANHDIDRITEVLKKWRVIEARAG